MYIGTYFVTSTFTKLPANPAPQPYHTTTHPSAARRSSPTSKHPHPTARLFPQTKYDTMYLSVVQRKNIPPLRAARISGLPLPLSSIPAKNKYFHSTSALKRHQRGACSGCRDSFTGLASRRFGVEGGPLRPPARAAAIVLAPKLQYLGWSIALVILRVMDRQRRMRYSIATLRRLHPICAATSGTAQYEMHRA
ncbi:hypothetical protein EJ06DRAFT_119279 [Trichodelitschia bisporula]|uniref:Uncharacterized protein n=1 Tax=Trichodelitschia bisporula TaxID=703511 RepID=A0A6G1HQ51_9PEZI|nr:hypothetical protein EJ06DRAFT_119279 [Trichodelitschia bisporula]